MAQELHLELLLGKRVRDMTGRPIGRIEEFRADQEEGYWIVHEYLVGRYGLYERLAAWSIIRALFGGHRRGASGYRIRWDQLDATDPAQLRLRCRREELVRTME
jgi:hypothetical protein